MTNFYALIPHHLALAGSGPLTFSEKFVLLRDGKNKTGSYSSLASAKDAGAITLNYGNFLQTIINFLVVAFILFFLIQIFQKLYNQKKEENTEQCPYCLEKIPKGAKKCKFCATELQFSPITPNQVSDAYLGVNNNASEASLLHKRH
ncbi:hypothetical protein HMI55_005227 [Coelomomyces lativittatus]|nr:hypothetical protein HMI55_005227 [Coelomomyces lativittatus]